MNKFAYLIIEEENKMQIVYKDNPKLTLEELYKAIGCHTIQVVRPYINEVRQNHIIMIIDEEGKLRNKETNLAATLLYNVPDDYIVGKCIMAKDVADGFEEPDLFAIPLDEAKMLYESYTKSIVQS